TLSPVAASDQGALRYASSAPAGRSVNAHKTKDHDRDLDATTARCSGSRVGWADVSAGINPVSFPLPDLPPESWTALPDVSATNALEKAARAFWNIPGNAAVLVARGASALIARIPALMPAATAAIPGPTRNEHAAAFPARGWRITGPGGDAMSVVHPNNPDSRLWSTAELSARLTVVDDSTADVASSTSHINLSARSGATILRRIGRFRCVIRARLGRAIGGPSLIAKLADWLGPWPVPGMARTLGTAL
ncbi:MAG: threonine-phosphate decarboxylase, partial [Paracoccaceae bacterium]